METYCMHLVSNNFVRFKFSREWERLRATLGFKDQFY